MKKTVINIIISLLAVAFLFTGCVSPHRTVGDEYIVQSVEYSRNIYKLRYYIEAKPVMEGTGAYTFNGLTLIYYTNTKYNVGDTIRICNKCEEKQLNAD